MKITETIFENVRINFVTINPKEYELKLISVPHAQNTKLVKDFCEENKGELAINGGLFNYTGVYAITGLAGYIDGIYSTNHGLVNNGGGNIPAIFCSKNDEIWQDVFTAYKDEKDNCKWVRSCAFYSFLSNNKLGCFSTVLERDSDGSLKSIIVPEYNSKKKRTMIGVKSDNTIIIACSQDPMTGEQQGRYMRDIRKCINGFNLDGGGSTHMYDGINKKYVVKGNRGVTDALVVVKKGKYVVPNTADISNSSFTMRLHSGNTNILDREISGSIKTNVPVSGKINILGLYGWPDSQGYRWAWGKYNGIEGAFKYDPRIMIIEGIPTGNYKMKLTGSAARLRERVVNGNSIIVVPNGSVIKILEFLRSIQSDGYQWCYGEYNGKRGYFQYDTAVMYPTND